MTGQCPPATQSTCGELKTVHPVQVHVERPQMDCFLTHTTAETHALIEANLAETPVYGGWVDAKGPRYCPSIEDKIVRFRDKDSHQVRRRLPVLHYTRKFGGAEFNRSLCDTGREC